MLPFALECGRPPLLLPHGPDPRRRQVHSLVFVEIEAAAHALEQLHEPAVALLLPLPTEGFDERSGRGVDVASDGLLDHLALVAALLGGDPAHVLEKNVVYPQVRPLLHVSIRERPPEAEDRAVPGHWEGDLICGKRNTHVATLVERSSRFVMLVRVRDKSTVSVVEALGNQVRELPKRMMDTLTWDRGMEMADHKKFTIATNVKVYFCDPSSPWQRGTNENTNRLLRQYLPKGTDLSVHSQQDLDAMALRLNTRPRKTLDYSTPADTLADTVALTG